MFSYFEYRGDLSMLRIKELFFKKEKVPTIRNTKDRTKKELGEELVKQGEQLANMNRFKEALQSFDRAIEIDSNNDQAYGDKALILDKIGKHDEAISVFSEALSINSDNPVTWHNKGLTLAQLKRIDEAIECFDKAIQKKEDYAKAWYNKGRCFNMLGNTENSQYCLNRARKLDPFLFTKVRRK